MIPLPSGAAHLAADRPLVDRLRDPARIRVLGDLPLRGDLAASLAPLLREAAAATGLPVVTVGLVLDAAVQLVAAHGLDGWIAAAGGFPVEWAFCRHVVGAGAPVVIPDAAVDPREAANPIVHVDGVRCYVGVPLLIEGMVVGTLCALGPAAAAAAPGARERLEALAPAVVGRLTLR